MSPEVGEVPALQTLVRLLLLSLINIMSLCEIVKLLDFISLSEIWLHLSRSYCHDIKQKLNAS